MTVAIGGLSHLVQKWTLGVFLAHTGVPNMAVHHQQSTYDGRGTDVFKKPFTSRRLTGSAYRTLNTVTFAWRRHVQGHVAVARCRVGFVWASSAESTMLVAVLLNIFFTERKCFTVCHIRYVMLTSLHIREIYQKPYDRRFIIDLSQIPS